MQADSPYRVDLEPNNTRRLAALCGQFDEHLRQIERRLNIEIRNRGNQFSIFGDTATSRIAGHLLKTLYRDTDAGAELTPDDIHLALQQAQNERHRGSTSHSRNPHHSPYSEQEPTMSETHAQKPAGQQKPAKDQDNLHSLTLIRTKKCTVKPRGQHQQDYVRAIQTHDINFGVGPAGTGKTYLAVACAVEALLNDEIERILLVRPAVEAGEKLGFLPGDLSQKVDPYLRPLYDALYEMLGFETVGKLIERSVIEVAPLAYMRGRTLNNSFIILDESQNTTREQMKMFLTRIGFGSTAVITGDPSQIDLPRGHASGLKHVIDVLKGVNGISFTHFDSKDVVRHPLVQRIVEAYESSEEADNKANTQPNRSGLGNRQD
ncbi:PhoH family protein [Aestuariicella hydrocarbonica]|uniref:PhoH-like protein n=1 Tax=Pseudomaricurvus hydrocarbonicus TaxID=1470433 RepID=A0A9E5JR85_9GAMM|nr:PhoH family protein [Aestuariicella hydrocarbonica]